MTANWRNPAEYPDPKTTKPARWAWEFLRRNPGYRLDWERYAALPETIRKGYGSLDYDEPGANMDWFSFDPPSKPGETFTEYRRRVGGNYGASPLEVALAKKHGIGHMADPTGDPRLLSWKTGAITSYGAFSDDGERYTIHVPAGEECIRFNLAWPIDPQLKRATWALGNLQASFKRQHPERLVSKRKREGCYRAYLRLLDAEEAGATKKDMAAALYPHVSNRSPEYHGSKAVENNLVAAKKLRDGDYLYLNI